ELLRHIPVRRTAAGVWRRSYASKKPDVASRGSGCRACQQLPALVEQSLECCRTRRSEKCRALDDAGRDSPAAARDSCPRVGLVDSCLYPGRAFGQRLGAERLGQGIQLWVPRKSFSTLDGGNQGRRGFYRYGPV